MQMKRAAIVPYTLKHFIQSRNHIYIYIFPFICECSNLLSPLFMPNVKVSQQKILRIRRICSISFRIAAAVGSNWPTKIQCASQ